MKLGWLWLSILKTTAWPSPMSITPAFSPGPWITHGALVGSPRRWMREDLYEQCSFHIAEKMPSSVKLGSRPISFRMRSYSSGFSPWAATSSGVILGSFFDMDSRLSAGLAVLRKIRGLRKALSDAFSRCPAFCSGGRREQELQGADGSDLRTKRL